MHSLYVCSQSNRIYLYLKQRRSKKTRYLNCLIWYFHHAQSAHVICSWLKRIFWKNCEHRFHLQSFEEVSLAGQSQAVVEKGIALINSSNILLIDAYKPHLNSPIHLNIVHCSLLGVHGVNELVRNLGELLGEKRCQLEPFSPLVQSDLESPLQHRVIQRNVLGSSRRRREVHRGT